MTTEKSYPLSGGRIAGDGAQPPPVVGEMFKGMADADERVREFTLPPTLEAVHGTWLNALRLIESMRGMYGGFPIDQYDHALQAATRAYRANASDELVLAALLHDVGKTISMSSHAEVAAAMLKPFVSSATYRILDTHTAFQGRYYFHLIGQDPDQYLTYRNEPWFDSACTFSTEWDCPAFDVGYSAKPLEDFVPLLQKFLGAKPKALFANDT